MGFFAVTTRRSPVRFTIEACHLVLWVLAKPWYRGFGYRFFFDVGLRIRPEGDLRTLRLALPFDTESNDLTDLSTIVLEPQFSPLIFGRPVKIDGDRIHYDGNALSQGAINDRVIGVSEEKSKPEEETADDVDFSTWKIELEDAARSAETTYVRFRFRVRDPKRFWASKGWGFAKRGVITDLRIADIRESLFLGEGRSEAEHIEPIKHLFLFLVAPAYFVPQHVSPELHYSRLLEPRVWNRYLASCGRYDGAIKFSIHEWRSVSDPVSVAKPYRAYADLSREFGMEVLLYYIAGTLMAPVLFRIGGKLMTWIVGS
jgi:hypothetical protein